MKRNRVKLKKVVFKSFCLFLVATVMVVISSARSHARVIEFAFGGPVSVVVPAEPPNDPIPAPWDGVQPGAVDAWSMMFTFESSVPMTYIEQFGLDAYDGAVTDYVFTVTRGGEVIGTVSGSPTDSWIFVLNGGGIIPPPPGSVGD